MLRAGASLLTEANFYRQFDSERATEVLKNVQARGVQVHCSAPLEFLVERNARRLTPSEQRPGHHVMLSEELLSGIRTGTWEPLDVPSEIIRVDTSRSFGYGNILQRICEVAPHLNQR